MADFTKTTKTEKITIAVLILLLASSLVVLFTRDNGFMTKKTSSSPGAHLIEPISN